MDSQKEISKHSLLQLSAVLAIVVLLFCILNFVNFNILRSTSITNIDQDNLVNWDINQVIISHNYVWFSGWALIVSEPLHTFDTNVVLRNIKTGESFELPTILAKRDELNNFFPDGVDHSQSGFLSRASNLLIDLDNNSYDIFLKFFNNGHHIFIDTGMQLKK